MTHPSRLCTTGPHLVVNSVLFALNNCDCYMVHGRCRFCFQLLPVSKQDCTAMNTPVCQDKLETCSLAIKRGWPVSARCMSSWWCSQPTTASANDTLPVCEHIRKVMQYLRTTAARLAVCSRHWPKHYLPGIRQGQTWKLQQQP